MPGRVQARHFPWLLGTWVASSAATTYGCALSTCANSFTEQPGRENGGTFDPGVPTTQVVADLSSGGVRDGTGCAGL